MRKSSRSVCHFTPALTHQTTNLSSVHATAVLVPEAHHSAAFQRRNVRSGSASTRTRQRCTRPQPMVACIPRCCKPGGYLSGNSGTQHAFNIQRQAASLSMLLLRLILLVVSSLWACVHECVCACEVLAICFSLCFSPRLFIELDPPSLARSLPLGVSLCARALFAE